MMMALPGTSDSVSDVDRVSKLNMGNTRVHPVASIQLSSMLDTYAGTSSEEVRRSIYTERILRPFLHKRFHNRPRLLNPDGSARMTVEVYQSLSLDHWAARICTWQNLLVCIVATINLIVELRGWAMVAPANQVVNGIILLVYFRWKGDTISRKAMIYSSSVCLQFNILVFALITGGRSVPTLMLIIPSFVVVFGGGSITWAIRQITVSSLGLVVVFAMHKLNVQFLHPIIFPTNKLITSALVSMVLLFVLALSVRGFNEGLMQELIHAHERATIASSVKESFLSTMSHELRNPLHGVLGNAEIIIKSPEIKTSQKKLVTQNVDAIHRFLYTVASLLDFSRLQTSSLPLDMGSVGLFDLLDGMYRTTRQELADVNCSLLCRTDRMVCDSTSCVFTDGYRLAQVIIEMISIMALAGNGQHLVLSCTWQPELFIPVLRHYDSRSRISRVLSAEKRGAMVFYVESTNRSISNSFFTQVSQKTIKLNMCRRLTEALGCKLEIKAGSRHPQMKILLPNARVHAVYAYTKPPIPPLSHGVSVVFIQEHEEAAVWTCDLILQAGCRPVRLSSIQQLIPHLETKNNAFHTMLLVLGTAPYDETTVCSVIDVLDKRYPHIGFVLLTTAEDKQFFDKMDNIFFVAELPLIHNSEIFLKKMRKAKELRRASTIYSKTLHRADPVDDIERKVTMLGTKHIVNSNSKSQTSDTSEGQDCLKKEKRKLKRKCMHLIAVDTHSNLSLLQQMIKLGDVPTNVDVFTDVKDCIGVFTEAHGPIDVVLIDLHTIPEGYDPIAHIRAIDENVYIVALSADVFAGERVRSMGYDTFLRKPFSIRQLEDVLVASYRHDNVKYSSKEADDHDEFDARSSISAKLPSSVVK